MGARHLTGRRDSLLIAKYIVVGIMIASLLTWPSTANDMATGTRKKSSPGTIVVVCVLSLAINGFAIWYMLTH